jgi:hypothetical protein
MFLICGESYTKREALVNIQICIYTKLNLFINMKESRPVLIVFIIQRQMHIRLLPDHRNPKKDGYPPPLPIFNKAILSLQRQAQCKGGERTVAAQ